uniref:Uncharacterized protein n=1 Tax=Chromera velia CCMP2878 TaxID=1169474 RepID=A0A0G4I2A3_9ALVE|eukprot:Cvel_35005.t1-p1 / transcript=Cvel_35005.t1 / gene=Cvel_35005 / organism=Chromera_velia_CCMP2878 / gene_product=hypothetical protein / transcript_product=hypothetical protein / location=Cvel_scaffold6217:1531-3947(+) / protein_length=628 / sequence_SO=supercontig / SO=protein_coding / is_pseudo=false
MLQYPCPVGLPEMIINIAGDAHEIWRALGASRQHVNIHTVAYRLWLFRELWESAYGQMVLALGREAESYESIKQMCALLFFELDALKENDFVMTFLFPLTALVRAGVALTEEEHEVVETFDQTTWKAEWLEDKGGKIERTQKRTRAGAHTRKGAGKSGTRLKILRKMFDLEAGEMPTRPIHSEGGKKMSQHTVEGNPAAVAWRKEVERGEGDAEKSWISWSKLPEWQSRFKCLQRSRMTALKATVRKLRGGSGAFRGAERALDVIAIGCLTAAEAAAQDAAKVDSLLREHIKASAFEWAKRKYIEERGWDLASQRYPCPVGLPEMIINIAGDAHEIWRALGASRQHVNIHTVAYRLWLFRELWESAYGQMVLALGREAESYESIKQMCALLFFELDALKENDFVITFLFPLTALVRAGVALTEEEHEVVETFDQTTWKAEWLEDKGGKIERTQKRTRAGAHTRKGAGKSGTRLKILRKMFDLEAGEMPTRPIHSEGGKKMSQHTVEGNLAAVAWRKEVERGEGDAEKSWISWSKLPEWQSRFKCLQRSRMTALKATVRKLRGGSGAFRGAERALDVTAIGCLTAAEAAAQDAAKVDSLLKEHIKASAFEWAKRKCIEERGGGTWHLSG